EAAVTFRWIGEFRRIESVSHNKRRHLRPRLRRVHALSIPAGETRALDHRVQRQRTKRVAIGEAQEAFTIHLLGLQSVGMPVEIADFAYGAGMIGTLRIGSSLRHFAVPF